MIIDAPKHSHIPALRALWQESFGDSKKFLDDFERTAFSVDRCRCVMIDEKVAAALYWFDCSCSGGRVAYLYAVATAKEYRRRGICHALMNDTHRHLKALGYMGSILVPGSHDLFEFYNRIGYRICSYIREFCCFALVNTLEIRQIDINEYAKLRRRFLPNNSVIQENENLEFLKTMVNFYMGKEFLLAARCEADVVYGAELLGDSAAAPAIVQALGCRKGKFRTPGTDSPFAMYYPLGDENSVPPSYFGLAFD